MELSVDQDYDEQWAISESSGNARQAVDNNTHDQDSSLQSKHADGKELPIHTQAIEHAVNIISEYYNARTIKLDFWLAGFSNINQPVLEMSNFYSDLTVGQDVFRGGGMMVKRVGMTVGKPKT